MTGRYPNPSVSIGAQKRGQSDPPAAEPSCRLSVVIPTRNEALNIQPLREELDSALGGINYEVIVVDDSTDELTRPALAATASQDDRWRVLERSSAEQTGLGTAVVEGLRAARGRLICVMDGDLQHPPDLIPALVRVVEGGADLAVASRYMAGGNRAGLAGRGREVISRAATGAARILFSEARRTSDPLTGFFCCRREAVAGLEYRPVGFKILLELLVCNPTLRVVDVALGFRNRNAGESKASTRQGLLYLKHMLSLFVYVPGSARTAKFGLVTAASLSVFFPLLIDLKPRLGWLWAWAIAAAVSVVVTAGLHHLFTFKGLAMNAEPGGARLYYAIGTVAAIASLLGGGLIVIDPHWHPWLLLGALTQCLGVALVLLLTRPWARKFIQARLAPVAPQDLSALGRRLGGQRSWWAEAGASTMLPERRKLVRAISPQLIETVARRGRPMLWMETPSSRPQARVNVEVTSALLLPRPTKDGRRPTVAVIARHACEPFRMHHLQRAISWLDRKGDVWELEARPAEAGDAGELVIVD